MLRPVIRSTWRGSALAVFSAASTSVPTSNWVTAAAKTRTKSPLGPSISSGNTNL
jgi:hypothetical protein